MNQGSIAMQPLPFGARLLEDGQTEFRFYAPAARDVRLEMAGCPPEPMQEETPGSGVYVLTWPCGAGTAYRYRFESATVGELAVPDPWSRAQQQDVHGFSLVVDPAAYAWGHACQGRPWNEAVVYEVHPGLVGGFAGLQQRLPVLAELGITVIELMPVADFPGGRNWGYDGVLMFAPDVAYGTPAQLKELVDTAHGLGMMVMLDVVYNHFGPDGNYIGTYAPDFFVKEGKNAWGSAIDFRQAGVQDFFRQNVLYWLREFRFDGLRFDAVQAIANQDWFATMCREVRAELALDDPLRQIHLVVEHDDNAARLLEPAVHTCDAQWNDDMHHVLHVLLTGETFGYYRDYRHQPAQRLARALEQGFVYQGEFSEHREAKRGESTRDLGPWNFISFLQNHDQIGNRACGERLLSLCEPRAFRAAQAMLLLMPQIPMLFMGEEQDETQPFLYFTSFADTGLAEAVRDGRRLEFAGQPEFSDTASLERIPDPNVSNTFEASRFAWEPASHPAFERIRALLALRAQFVAPGIAGSQSTGAEVLGSGAVRAGWKLGSGAGGSILTIFVNLHAGCVPVMTQEVTGHLNVLHDSGEAGESVREAIVNGQLPGYSCLIFLRNQNG